MSGAAWTPAAARRDLGALVACVGAGAWLAPMLSGVARDAVAAAAGIVGFGWAVLSLRAEGVSRRELGLRFDDLHRSGPAFLACALVAVAGFAAAGRLDLGHPGRLGDPARLARYGVWALFQQFLVVGVAWRHVARGLAAIPPALSLANLRLAALTALVFAAIHAPNARLMLLVLIAETVWLLLFARFRNLLALAVAHAVSALAAAEALQPGWLPTARIGLGYLQR